MKLPFHCWMFGAAASATVAAAALSSAASPSDPNQALPRVSIILTGPAADDPTLRRRVTAWFDGDTVVEFANEERLDPGHPLVPPPQAGVRVRVRLHAGGADLELVATGTHAPPPRALSRRVPLEHGLDEIGRERLAQVIHSASVALWEGRELKENGVSVEAPSDTPPGSSANPPPAQPPPRAPSRTQPDSPSRAPAAHRRERVANKSHETGSRWHLAPGLGYGATAQGGEGLGHGPCMRATVTTPLPGSELTFEAQFRLPHRFTAGPAEVELQVAAIRAGAGWMIARASPVAPYGWIGVGPDVITYGTTRLDEGAALEISPGDRRMRASAAIAVGAAVALSPDLALRIEARADVPFYRARYQVEAGSGPVTEASAWPVQPGLFLVFDTSRRPE